MEHIDLNDTQEITDFLAYVDQYKTEVVSNISTNKDRVYYTLLTDQVISIPEPLKYNSLIFGKNQEEEIVNISYKSGNISIYFKNGTLKVIPYKPYCLTGHETKTGSKLKGTQYYKYITHLDDAKYNELKDQWDKRFWFPRSIEEGFMMLNGHTYFKNLKVNDVSYLSFDIENQNENEVDKDELVVLITNTFRNSNGEYTRKVFSIKEYKSSIKMVNAWCDWVRSMNPDVMAGHNIFLHDLRILNLVAPLKLGKDDSYLEFEKRVSKIRKDAQQQYEYHSAQVHGRELIDTWFMSIKYDIGREFPSYGLKVIEKHLKLVSDDRIAWDFSRHPVRDVIKDDVLWADFTKYAETDADSPIKMIDIMLPSLFYLNQSVPQSLQSLNQTNTGGQINNFLIRSYLQEGASIPRADRIEEKIEGGISFAVPGVYRNLFKVDIKSCYPSQVLRFKLYDIKKDPEANFYKMVKHFTEARFELKKQYQETKLQYYKDRDAVSKVFINSAYGMTITNYLNFNSPEIGKKITAESRAVIDMALIWASGNGKDYWMKLFKEKTGQVEEIKKGQNE